MSTKAFNMSKLLEMFKNIKSDAVPRSPRNTKTNREEQPQAQVEVEDIVEEEIVIEEPEEESEKKQKPKKQDHENNKKTKKSDDDDEDIINCSGEKQHGTTSVNVQATGSVTNIVNASNVRLGDDYYFGPTYPGGHNGKRYEEDNIVKDNLITLIMEATIRPNHDYMDYISKNLGKNWFSVYRSLGFTPGRIETAEYDAGRRGCDTSEARYKLLLEWVNNDDDGTLGHLATLLWEEGERSIVKQLSVMYKKNKK